MPEIHEIHATDLLYNLDMNRAIDLINIAHKYNLSPTSMEIEMVGITAIVQTEQVEIWFCTTDKEIAKASSDELNNLGFDSSFCSTGWDSNHIPHMVKEVLDKRMPLDKLSEWFGELIKSYEFLRNIL